MFFMFCVMGRGGCCSHRLEELHETGGANQAAVVSSARLRAAFAVAAGVKIDTSALASAMEDFSVPSTTRHGLRALAQGHAAHEPSGERGRARHRSNQDTLAKPRIATTPAPNRVASQSRWSGQKLEPQCATCRNRGACRVCFAASGWPRIHISTEIPRSPSCQSTHTPARSHTHKSTTAHRNTVGTHEHTLLPLWRPGNSMLNTTFFMAKGRHVVRATNASNPAQDEHTTFPVNCSVQIKAFVKIMWPVTHQPPAETPWIA